MRWVLNIIYYTKSLLLGGLSPHPLSPKAVGVQNPPPQERKICVYKVALVVEWTPANKPLLSPIILGLHSPL